MTLNSQVVVTVNNNEGYEDNQQQKNEPSHPPPPGNQWKRLYKRIWMHLVIAGLYRGGLDFVKGMATRCPKVDLSKRKSNHVCVITGGARGIGLEIVKILLQLDYTVVMGVRNVTSVETTIKNLETSNKYSGQVKILHLDLKSLQSVRRFATEVLTLPEARRIDLLINNAGMFQHKYEVTEDNIECHFQVNYLSHFLLTNLLLPRIKETAEMKKCDSDSPSQTSSSTSCHIINTCSRFQRVASLEFNNLSNKKLYEPIKCYCDTKLCQIMHAKSIQNQLTTEGVSNVHMVAVHPGEIPSNLWRQYGKIETLVHSLLKAVCRTKEEAANIVLYPALHPTFSEVSGGEYFEADKITKPHPQALDEKMRERLWEISMELTLPPV